jgi:hypothetical protein
MHQQNPKKKSQNTFKIFFLAHQHNITKRNQKTFELLPSLINITTKMLHKLYNLFLKAPIIYLNIPIVFLPTSSLEVYN